MAAIQRSSERCLQRKFRASDVLLNHQNNCFQLLLAPLKVLHMQSEISEGAQVVRVHVFHNILDLNASDREETPGKYPWQNQRIVGVPKAYSREGGVKCAESGEIWVPADSPETEKKTGMGFSGRE